MTILAKLQHLYLLKKDTKFNYSENSDAQEAFKCLREKLVSAPILAFPDFSKRMILQCDASNYSVGFVLSQIQNGSERVIAYGSKMLTDAQKKYPSVEKEALAIVYGVEHYRPFLYGLCFEIVTDCQPLKWLMTRKNLNPRLMRWALMLQSYNFIITHRPGKKNSNADSLSRLISNVENLPPTIDNSNFLVKHQRKDPFLMSIITYLHKEELPKNYSSTFKTIAQNCFLENNILHYKREKVGSKKQHLVFIPKSLRTDVCEAYHNDPLSGHFGFGRTFQKIQSKYFWVDMKKHIKNWCQACTECTILKTPNKRPRAPLVPIPVNFPWEKVHVDVAGPLNETDSGNTHFIEFIDSFTKYNECVAISDTSAANVARIFYNEIVCRHSCPNYLISDQGANFLSKLVKEVTKILNVTKLQSVAWNPKCNGQVEKQHRTLKQTLRFYASTHRNWDSFIPSALFAYRTGVHAATGYSPFFLNYGRDCRLPLDTVLTYPVSKYTDYRDFTQDLVLKLRNAWNITYDNIRKSKERYKEIYDRTAVDVNYQPGDKVFIYQQNVNKSSSRTFAIDYKGPMRVVQVELPNLYVKTIPDNDKPPKKVHADNVRMCHDLFLPWFTKTPPNLSNSADNVPANARYNLRPRN